MTMMNMKKQYVKPILEVVNIEYETMMLTVSGEQSSAGTGSGTAGNDTPDLSNRHRGTWGNLWN